VGDGGGVGGGGDVGDGGGGVGDRGGVGDGVGGETVLQLMNNSPSSQFVSVVDGNEFPEVKISNFFPQF